MKFTIPKWKHASKAARAVANSSAIKSSSDGDDAHSVGSSLCTSRSDSAAFENGVVVKTVDDSVLMDQAAESLRSALDLIGEASNKMGSWVDARDLLDRTAAALDDAGLALRSSSSSHAVRPPEMRAEFGSKKGSKSGRTSIIGRREKNSPDSSDLPPTEALIHDLADEIVDKRRRILGDMLVHDADGIWAKSEYGDGDGISFGAADDVLFRVPDEAKDNRALIAWASQTGTAKKFARHLHKALGGDGRCVLSSMRGMSVQNLAKHKRVYVICSTFGIGRPPREGEVFYSLAQLAAMRCKENAEDLSEGEVEKPLAGTSVAVAALGSSAFQDFAKFGLGLAEELGSLGASSALKITTLDAKNGKSEQKKSFRKWEKMIIETEKERLAEWRGKISLEKKFSSKAA